MLLRHAAFSRMRASKRELKSSNSRKVATVFLRDGREKPCQNSPDLNFRGESRNSLYINGLGSRRLRLFSECQKRYAMRTECAGVFERRSQIVLAKKRQNDRHCRNEERLHGSADTLAAIASHCFPQSIPRNTLPLGSRTTTKPSPCPTGHCPRPISAKLTLD